MRADEVSSASTVSVVAEFLLLLFELALVGSKASPNLLLFVVRHLGFPLRARQDGSARCPRFARFAEHVPREIRSTQSKLSSHSTIALRPQAVGTTAHSRNWLTLRQDGCRNAGRRCGPREFLALVSTATRDSHSAGVHSAHGGDLGQGDTGSVSRNQNPQSELVHMVAKTCAGCSILTGTEGRVLAGLRRCYLLVALVLMRILL